MDFRKVETGNMKLQAVREDMIGFICELKKAFDEFSGKHNIDFKFVSEFNSLDVWFDPDKMEKILYNLLSNAFKFTPDNGKVEVNVLKDKMENGNECVKIIVKDSGIGISSDRLTKIFNRFYQIENSDRLKRTIEREGTGIGLSLTRELILLHHGSINVESEEGKRLYFYC
ncbi:MAG: HAMP domain-containing histidine kinase [Bacteroidales bacterium]|nr:HAMP domain-containing histidine kinase [Bacteroidales bacterium]